MILLPRAFLAYLQTRVAIRLRHFDFGLAGAIRVIARKLSVLYTRYSIQLRSAIANDEFFWTFANLKRN